MEEVLNIISESYCRNLTCGPNKVIVNTLKGLDKIGYPYVINKNIRYFKYNWIHDSVRGLIETGLYKKPALIGPNIVVLPKDLPRFRPVLTNCIYLHPSQWCVDVWKQIGFSECQVRPWPVGIDAADFYKTKRDPSGKEIMIYYKRRDPLLLDKAISIVKSIGFNPLIIKYGEYNEGQYKQILSKCKFGIWLGISESQGIGLQEAMASGLPLIVCDVNSLFESANEDDYKFPEKLRNFKPTSAPYFEDRCGIIINDFSKLKESIVEMSSNLSFYRPHDFIIDNFSLEKQAMELLSFFDILEPWLQNHSAKSSKGKDHGNFQSSFQGRIIYLIFIIILKTKTLFRILIKHLETRLT